MNISPRTMIGVGAAGALALAACTPVGDDSPTDASLTVATAVYPLEWLVGEVGGSGVEVLSLTPPGVEPHDVELAPSTVIALGGADLAVYIPEFQAAVDAAIETTGVAAFDVSEAIELHSADHDHDDEHADEDEHADDEHADEDGHDHGDLDPHFWLDPTLMAELADVIAAELGAADPANAALYVANADTVSATLLDIDTQFTTGLATCERDEIFVSHEAFGYLAERYGLEQEGLSGLDPEAEPSPARLLEIAALMEEHGATTIYADSAVSATVAEALAADAGATTAVLDPIETVAADDDYAGVMLRNLDALRTGLGCA